MYVPIYFRHFDEKRGPQMLNSPFNQSSAERPVEQAVITFFDLPCLAIRGANGAIYLAVRDLCDAIGVQLSAQLRRIRACAIAEGIAVVPGGNGWRLSGSGISAPPSHRYLAADD